MKKIIIIGLLIVTYTGFAQNKSNYSPDSSVYKSYIGEWESQDENFQLEFLNLDLEFNGEIENMIIGYYKYHSNGKIVQKTSIEDIDHKNFKMDEAPLIGGYDKNNDELVLFMNDALNKKRGKVTIELINNQLFWELKANPGEIQFEIYDPSVPFSIPRKMILKRKD